MLARILLVAALLAPATGAAGDPAPKPPPYRIAAVSIFGGGYTGIDHWTGADRRRLTEWSYISVFVDKKRVARVRIHNPGAAWHELMTVPLPHRRRFTLRVRHDSEKGELLQEQRWEFDGLSADLTHRGHYHNRKPTLVSVSFRFEEGKVAVVDRTPPEPPVADLSWWHNVREPALKGPIDPRE